jgi:ribosome-associated heat shock protein Hsp15
MDNPPSIRIDKWLWAVRIYKTRALSTDACRSNHVKINGLAVKASHTTRIGETLDITLPELTKTVKVLGIIDQRVSGTVAKDYVEDLTPPSFYQTQRDPVQQPLFVRKKGTGRPTKKDRRAMDELM